MKVILFLVFTGIYNDSGSHFHQQMEKEYRNLEHCIRDSILMRKVLRAEDNLQIRQTDVYAHCEISKEGMEPDAYNQAQNKLRRLEKFYSSAKW